MGWDLDALALGAREAQQSPFRGAKELSLFVLRAAAVRGLRELESELDAKVNDLKADAAGWGRRCAILENQARMMGTRSGAS